MGVSCPLGSQAEARIHVITDNHPASPDIPPRCSSTSSGDAQLPKCVMFRSCVPWFSGFFSLLLKVFHQLARSFFSLTDSLDGVGRGPRALAGAVHGSLVVMPSGGPVAIATPCYCMRDELSFGRLCRRNRRNRRDAVGRPGGWNGRTVTATGCTAGAEDATGGGAVVVGVMATNRGVCRSQRNARGEERDRGC